MPTKPIERLMFAQGGACFFCRQPLSKSEASVEHLVALTHGGKDGDENCVACCKSLNALFGRMSLKEKMQILLNQRGNFVCPGSASTSKVVAKVVPAKAEAKQIDLFKSVVADLLKRGNARPGKQDKLMNTIKAHLAHQNAPPNCAEDLLAQLVAKKYIAISEGKVVYALPQRGV